MFVTEAKIRVRYGESDRMGYVYYGNYPLYYEVGRTEAMRELGLTYKDMEDDGIILPVANLQCNYLAPAMYDDLLTIKTFLKEVSGVRLKFEHEIYNEKGEKLNYGETTLVFTNAHTRKPCRPPQYFLDRVRQYF